MTSAALDTASPADQEFLESLDAIPEAELDFLRDVAKNDLYSLSKGILGYRQVSTETHGAFCRFIQNESRKRRLGLMPRAHLKSTLATIADSVRLAVRDPNETRILIAGETATNAEKFLSEIKGHFEKNKILRKLFPELIPTRFAGPGVQWSNSFATINRTTVYKEATWSTIGVGGAIVGGHFNRIKCDDLIGIEAFKSMTVMEAAIEWVEHIDPLLVDQHIDIIDFIGTRWLRRDLYARVMKLYGSQLRVFTREAIEDGVVIFPAMHTLEEYERMQRETPGIWYSQYCNNPLAAGQADFPSSGVNSYRFRSDGSVELDLPDGSKKNWEMEDLHIVIAADPNSGSIMADDTAACVVSGISPDDEIIVLHTWSDRVSPSAFVDKIFELWERWKPRVVGIEKAGQQTTQHYFERKAEESGIYVHTIPLHPKQRDKIYRIRTALEPIIRSGRIWCLATQTVLRTAIDEFPDTHPIDELDALAYGVEPGMWKKPFRQEDIKKKDNVLQLVINRRSMRTGY